MARDFIEGSDFNWNEFHDWTKDWNPGDHYAVDWSWKAGTRVVEPITKLITKWFGNDRLERANEHDQQSFDRTFENSLAGAALYFGGMYGSDWLGSLGGGSGASGGGSSGWLSSLGGGGGGMGWGDIIGGVGNLLGGVMQSEGAKDAAEIQANATREGVAEQRRQFDLQREDSLPYRIAGVGALGDLSSEMNRPVTAEEVMADPGYQFGLDQGQRAIDRKIAASGGRVSGRAIKEAARYGGDYATTRYNSAYQRRQDRLNRLAAIAGIGQTATNSSAAAGANTANAISGLVASQGDASAAARMAQGNIWASTGNQLAALYGRNQQRGGGYGGTTYGSTRGYDPYSDPMYYGGGEGE